MSFICANSVAKRRISFEWTGAIANDTNKCGRLIACRA